MAIAGRLSHSFKVTQSCLFWGNAWDMIWVWPLSLSTLFTYCSAILYIKLKEVEVYYSVRTSFKLNFRVSTWRELALKWNKLMCLYLPQKWKMKLHCIHTLSIQVNKQLHMFLGSVVHLPTWKPTEWYNLLDFKITTILVTVAVIWRRQNQNHWVHWSSLLLCLLNYR